MTMKRIAFIDHDIANWHANTFARLLAESDRGYALAEISFSATVSNPHVTRSFVVDEGGLFISGLSGILDFFDAGKALVDRRETLAIMNVLQELRRRVG